MGFSPPVPQQDSNWEIRVAVLISLLLQILLIFLGPTRKRYFKPLPRFAVWSCYLLADWVADLALGLLLNNMGNIGGGGGGGSSSSSFGMNSVNKIGGASAAAGNNGSGASPPIFAFWTPFLLLHLGGPDTITAYALEDNDLWLRHLVGLLFSLVSATVVMGCSFQGNPMNPATFLVFLAGTVKYGERTYCLYCGSGESLRSKALAGPPERGWNYARFMSVFNSRRRAGLEVAVVIPNGEATSLAQMQAEQAEWDVKSVEARAYEFFLVFKRLFVNLIFSYQERLLSKAFFLHRQGLRPDEAYEVVKMELNFAYDMVYTKAPVAYTRAGWGMRCFASCFLLAALGLFIALDKRDIRPVDVGITYTLLLGALALDAAALAMLLLSDRGAVILHESRWRWAPVRRLYRFTQAVREWWRPQRWSQSAAQLNLLSYALRLPAEPRCWHGLSRRLHVQELFEDLMFVRYAPISDRLLEVLFHAVKKAALAAEEEQEQEKHKEKEQEKQKEKQEEEERKKEEAPAPPGGRQRHSLSRGEGAISRHEEEIVAEASLATMRVLLQSITRADFDESLLLWHIATDIIRVDKDVPTRNEAWSRPIAIALSEYLLYLLVKQPEMVSPRSGIWLMRYQDTCEEARNFTRPMAAATHEDAREVLLGVNTSPEEVPAEVRESSKSAVLLQACILAKELKRLDPDLRWRLVAAVWVEMFVFTARACSGTTHLRQLNLGGELITLVWFLTENMGLGDTYLNQMPKLIVQY